MSAKHAIRDFMLKDASITAIVESRIFPHVAPEGTALPYLCIHRITGPGGHHLGGGNAMREETFQIDVFESTSPKAEALSDAVRNRLHGYRGRMGRIMVDRAMVEQESDDDEPPATGAENPVFWTRMDLAIAWKSVAA